MLLDNQTFNMTEMAKTSPTYNHPSDSTVNIDTQGRADRRYSITIDFEEPVNQRVLVILKNPSKATKTISDKTVSNVTSYFTHHRQSKFRDCQGLEILNIFPHYETDSGKLIELGDLVDEQNHRIIDEKIANHETIILAYGDHPSGLKELFDQEVLRLLNTLEGKRVYIMKKLSNNGNPTHGQVWSNDYNLLSATIQEGEIKIR